jgi:prepilin-type N-terminal cleavage/methylation domain-containing protein
MLARLRKSAENKDSGFTLIELLVVMIIIGILAAIAIPAFLSQKKKAYTSSVRSDLRAVAQEIESYASDNAIAAGTAVTRTGRHSASGRLALRPSERRDASARRRRLERRGLLPGRRRQPPRAHCS